MLNLQGKTVIVSSKEFSVQAGSLIGAEGIALARAEENGEEVVIPSTGSSDVFMGFSYGQTMTPLTKSLVQSLVVPAALTVTLDKEPVSGQIFITNGTTEQTAGNPATTANEYSISGKVITFHADQEDATMTTTIRYSPTAMELVYSDDLDNTSVSATDYLSSIGAIQTGEIFTDMFDAGDEFVGGAACSMGAGGLVVAGTGNTIPNAIISHVPNSVNPFLGIRFL